MKFFNDILMQKTNYYKTAILWFSLDGVWVGWFYDRVIQRKLHRFKFVHNTVDIVYFETMFRELIHESGIKNTEEYLIVYPAISLKDRLLRWPNHAKRLAKIFARTLGVKNIYCPFQKKFFAGHQSRRNKAQREQIQWEYQLKKNSLEIVRGKEIILVDDIITTWYTAHTLGLLLKREWSGGVIGFFLASHKT